MPEIILEDLSQEISENLGAEDGELWLFDDVKRAQRALDLYAGLHGYGSFAGVSKDILSNCWATWCSE